jgi:hypothetical protein
MLPRSYRLARPKRGSRGSLRFADAAGALDAHREGRAGCCDEDSQRTL